MEFEDDDSWMRPIPITQLGAKPLDDSEKKKKKDTEEDEVSSSNNYHERKAAGDEDNHGGIIREFELRKHFDVTHFMGVIFGCSGSGKSFLMKHLLCELKKINYWKEFYLISPTEKLSHSFNCFDKDNVKDEFDEGWLQGIIDEKVSKIKDQQKLGVKNPRTKPTFIVIDDCAADKRIRNSPALNKLFISGRHFNMGVVLLMQNINARDSVPLPVRNNATLIVTGRPRKQKDREFLVREWFSMGSERDGEALLMDITSEQFQFAVLNLQQFASSTDLNQFVYKAKAPPTSRNFSLCKKTQTQPYDQSQGTLMDKKVDKYLATGHNTKGFSPFF